jgi:hydrogenase maturation protein HypF
VISAKFHNTLAFAILAVAEKARSEHNTKTAVLAGGVFLNKQLLARTESLLEKNGFEVLRPIQYSPNDESISLGQIAYGLARVKNHS